MQIKPRIKPRYFTREEIERDIDKATQKAAKLMGQAEELDLVADQWFRKPLMVERAIRSRLDAKKCRRQATRLMNKRVKFLSDKLAEFMTIPLFPEADNSVKATSR